MNTTYLPLPGAVDTGPFRCRKISAIVSYNSIYFLLVGGRGQQSEEVTADGIIIIILQLFLYTPYHF
jgi:hypothetical protein